MNKQEQNAEINQKFLNMVQTLAYQMPVKPEEYAEFLSLLDSGAFSDEQVLNFMTLVGSSGNATLFKDALSKINLFDDSAEINEVEKTKFISLLGAKEESLENHFQIERLYFDIISSNAANIIQNYIAGSDFNAAKKRKVLKIMAENGFEKLLSTMFEREIHKNGPAVIGNDIDVVYKSVQNSPIMLFADESHGKESYLDILENYKNQVVDLKSRKVMSRTQREKVANFDPSAYAKVVATFGTDIDIYRALKDKSLDVETLARNLKTPHKILYLAKYLTGKKSQFDLDTDTLERILNKLSNNMQYDKNLTPDVFMPFLEIEGTNAHGVSIALACSTDENFKTLADNNVELLQILDKPGISHGCMAEVLDRVGSNEAVSHYLLFYTPDVSDNSPEASNTRHIMNELYAGRNTEGFVELMDLKAEKFDGSTLEEIEEYKQSEILRLRKLQAERAIAKGDETSEIAKRWLSSKEREIVHDVIVENQMKINA